MTEDKDYRKALGFASASAIKDYMSAKDLKLINWDLIQLYNSRLIESFIKIQLTMPTDHLSIEKIVTDAYFTIRNNNLLAQFNNHGRSIESVYYNWMQGYITATIFKSFIEERLNCKLTQNGADDLNKPQIFAKKSDPDFIDANEKIFVEVQAGFKGGKIDIKRSKIKTTLSDYDYYIVCIDCFNGKYCILSVKELLTLPESVWYKNPQWENALCYTIDESKMKPWVRRYTLEYFFTECNNVS